MGTQYVLSSALFNPHIPHREKRCNYLIFTGEESEAQSSYLMRITQLMEYNKFHS